MRFAEGRARKSLHSVAILWTRPSHARELSNLFAKCSSWQNDIGRVQFLCQRILLRTLNQRLRAHRTLVPLLSAARVRSGCTTMHSKCLPMQETGELKSSSASATSPSTSTSPPLRTRRPYTTRWRRSSLVSGCFSTNFLIRLNFVSYLFLLS